MSILKGGTQTVNYLSFDGVNDYVDLGSKPEYNLSQYNSWEIELDVRLNNVSKNNTRIFSRGQFGSSSLEYRLQSSENEIIFELEDQIIDTFPANNDFYNIKIIYESGNVDFFINGNLENSQNINLSRDTDRKLILGAQHQDNGSIDLFGEIDLYYFRITANNSDILEYDFSNINNNILLDNTSNNNDGTIYGATWQTETVSPAIQNIYYGSNEVSRVFLGESLLFGQPPILSGEHYYLIPNYLNNEVYYYNLLTPFDLDNKGSADFVLNVSGVSRVDNIIISNDGTIFYIGESFTNTVKKYILNTPFDLSTAAEQPNVNRAFNVSNGHLTCFNMADEGKKYYETNHNGSIIQYDLSTPYDITTRTQTGSLGGFPGNGPGDPAFSPDGTKVVIGRREGNTIVGGTCSTPFDLSTYTQTHTATTSDDDPSSCKWNADGTKLLVRHASPDMVNEYTVSTPYTLDGFGNERQIFDNPNFAAGGHEFNYNW